MKRDERVRAAGAAGKTVPSCLQDASLVGGLESPARRAEATLSRSAQDLFEVSGVPSCLPALQKSNLSEKEDFCQKEHTNTGSPSPQRSNPSLSSMVGHDASGGGLPGHAGPQTHSVGLCGTQNGPQKPPKAMSGFWRPPKFSPVSSTLLSSTEAVWCPQTQRGLRPSLRSQANSETSVDSMLSSLVSWFVDYVTCLLGLWESWAIPNDIARHCSSLGQSPQGAKQDIL